MLKIQKKVKISILARNPSKKRIRISEIEKVIKEAIEWACTNPKSFTSKFPIMAISEEWIKYVISLGVLDENTTKFLQKMNAQNWECAEGQELERIEPIIGTDNRLEIYDKSMENGGKMNILKQSLLKVC